MGRWINKELTEDEKKAISEIQEMYICDFNRGKFERCKALISVLCILNKHLTGDTGYEISFEGSKNDLMENVFASEN